MRNKRLNCHPELVSGSTLRLAALMAAAAALAIPHLHASVQTQINNGATPSVNVNNTYQKAAFAAASATLQTPTMYLGAGRVGDATGVFTAADQAASLVSVALSTETGKVAGKVSSLAPVEKVVVINGNTVTLAASPLAGQGITNLKIYNGLPVVTLAGLTDVYALTKADGTAMLNNKGDGSAFSNIKDANAANTKAIVGLAVGTANAKETVFAAVTETAKDWQTAVGAADGANRGIAVLRPNDAVTELEVLDATNFGGGADAKAAGLKVAATTDAVAVADRGPIAFYVNGAAAGTFITNAELGPNVDMHWSENLKRLYIGLNNVHRDDPTKEGGIMGLVMGYVKPEDTAGPTPEQLILQPVVAGTAGLKKELFYDIAAPGGNYSDRIVGFYFDGSVLNGGHAAGGDFENNGDEPVSVSINQVRDMVTSTGKNYVIVNSNIGGGGAARNARVYALPVAPIIDPNGVAVAAEKVGTILKVAGGKADWGGDNKTVSFPGAFGEMPTAADAPCKVGSFNTDNISDIFVNGDTVYMTMNGNTAATAGIFASTALFDENGIIRDWTQPVRVTGDVNSTLSAGLDDFGNFYAATGASNNPTKGATFTDINTVKVTQWGKSDDVTPAGATNNLSSFLATEFPESTGGIVGMFSFDQTTPGFRTNQFAMLVVVGPTKIALIQMGTYGAGGFLPTQTFAKDGANPNVFIRDTTTDPDLANIAPMTCAEVSRMTDADSGWLFVGGYGGVAVLRTVAGAGFASQAPGLGVLTGAPGYPGNTGAGAVWTFKQLTPNVNADAFNNVIKMVAWNDRMYVVTLDGVFFFDMAANKFTDAAPAPLTDDKVAGLPDDVVVADLVVLCPTTAAGGGATTFADNRGVIATDQGLFASQLTNVVAETVKIDDVQFGELGLQLQLLGADKRSGNAPSSANVMVLGVDFKNNNDQLYRMDVGTAAGAPGADFAKPVKSTTDDTTGQVVSFESTKQGFNTDVTGVIDTLPKHFDHIDYVTLNKVKKTTSTDITSLLNVNTSTEKWVSGVVREGAFGAVLVPGDFGVRVNE